MSFAKTGAALLSVAIANVEGAHRPDDDLMMKPLLVSLFAMAAAMPQATRTFSGTITDSMCERADHSHMRMGPTDAECAVACAEEHEAAFVLYDGKDVYTLSDQKAAQKFAARKVTVVGALDARTRTIKVTSIALAK